MEPTTALLVMLFIYGLGMMATIGFIGALCTFYYDEIMAYKKLEITLALFVIIFVILPLWPLVYGAYKFGTS